MFRIILILTFITSTTYALQLKQLHKDNRILADISLDSINRIYVEDDRIAQVFGLNEDLVIETDNNTGQIFLRTKQNKPIDLSIITEKQVTLDLRLLPKDISGETIIIKTNKPTEPAKFNAKTTSYLDRITTLMLAMANSQSITSFTINKVHKEILLWEKIELLQTSEYIGNKLIGEVYSLTNKTQDRIFLTETQFGWQQGVAGVAIKKHALALKETTQIYVVRHAA
jgi:type-F conjugative transfer system secretin TraK